QQVALEVVLIMQINVEAREVAVLREEKLRRRITGVGEENIWIALAADANQVLDEFSDAAHAQPAHHRARDLIADEIAEDGGMTAMRRDRFPDHSGNLIARRFLAQKLHMFRPGQRDEDAHSRRGAAIQ